MMADDSVTPRTNTTMTPDELTAEYIAEIKRIAEVEPCAYYMLGALKMTITLMLDNCPDAREYIERRIAHSKTLPTPTKSN